MTTTRDFDRMARAWLDLMPDEAPDRLIANVRLAVDITPQQRRWGRLAFRRPFQMNRLMLIAATAVVALALVGGSILLVAGRPGPTFTPTLPTGLSSPPPASPEASTAAGDRLPADLVAGWYGPDRDLPGLAARAGSVLFLDPTAMRFTQSNQQDSTILRASASIVGSRLQLVSSSAESYAGGVTCPKGTTGTYDATVSASGQVLTVTRFSDPCSGRSNVVSGTWWKKACWNDGACYGNLDAGTYGTQYFDPRVDPAGLWQPNYGAVTFTVPQGWAMANDSPDEVRLMLASDYAREGSGTDPSDLPILRVLRQPFPKVGGRDCATPSAPPGGPGLGDPRGPADIVTFLQSQSWLQASAPQTLTIDGHSATSIDLAISASAPPGCPGETGPSGEYLTGYGVESWGIGLDGGRRTRLVLIDLGTGDVVAAVIEAPEKAAFDGFVGPAMQVMGTLRFE